MTGRPMTDQNAATAALLLRVSLGVMFLAHGLVLKLLTFGVGGTAGYFQSIGYPAVFAYIVIAAEILAGIALVLGVWVRAVALLAVPILLGATLQHLPNGWVFVAPGGGWEFPAFWTVALVVQALLGEGRYALGNPLAWLRPAAGKPALT